MKTAEKNTGSRGANKLIEKETGLCPIHVFTNPISLRPRTTIFFIFVFLPSSEDQALGGLLRSINKSRGQRERQWCIRQSGGIETLVDRLSRAHPLPWKVNGSTWERFCAAALAGWVMLNGEEISQRKQKQSTGMNIQTYVAISWPLFLLTARNFDSSVVRKTTRMKEKYFEDFWASFTSQFSIILLLLKLFFAFWGFLW